MEMGERPAYAGQENATVDRVTRYLRENYGEADGTPLTEERLSELVVKHVSTIRKAIEFASFAYYPGDQIARAEKLDYIGPDEN
ncbi:hypothetical protein [Micromonospora sp. NPDC005652]|uniref:hypothetical protein n=1 Tax=Micromonospora sp. NPDC005652 TaxID=3157046 RepID=UPI003408E995